MRRVLNFAIILLLILPVLAQAQDAHTRDDRTKEEIQKLFSELNEAKSISIPNCWKLTSAVTGAVLRLGSCQDSRAKKIE